MYQSNNVVVEVSFIEQIRYFLAHQPPILGLALGYAADPWPWLYPLYYVALLFPRQHADDKRCAEKYGELWQEYCRRVPYRIIPWVY